MSEEDLVHTLGRINNNITRINDRLNKIDIFIARSEEREIRQSEVIKSFTDQTEKAGHRIRAVEDHITQTKPFIEGVGKWLFGIITVGTAMIIGFFVKGN